MEQQGNPKERSPVPLDWEAPGLGDMVASIVKGNWFPGILAPCVNKSPNAALPSTPPLWW